MSAQILRQLPLVVPVAALLALSGHARGATNTTDTFYGTSTGNLGTAASWNVGSGTTHALPGIGNDAIFPVGAATGIRVLGTSGTPVNLTVGSFDDLATSGTQSITNPASGTTAATLTLGGTGDLGNSISGNTADLLYVASGGTFNINNGATGALNLVLGQSGNFDVVGSMNISALISGAFSVAKTGAGTLTLSGANTYSGGTTVGGGILAITQDSAIDSGTGGITFGGGVLQFNNYTSSLVFSSGSVSLGAATGTASTLSTNITGASTSLTYAGPGTLILAGVGDSYSGSTSISAGILQFSKVLTMSANSAVTVASGGTLAVNVGGTGEFTDGSGISAAGTIGGLLNGVGGQGSSVTFASGSAIGIDTTNATGAITYSSGITNSGLGLNKLGTGTFILTGSNSYSGITTITGGTLQIGNNGTTGTLGTGSVTDNSILSFNYASGTVVTVSNTISGSGTLVQNGAGTVILSAASNTQTGDSIINAGVLELLTTTNQLGSATNNPTINAGALRIDSGVISSRGIIVGASTSTVDVASGQSTSFSGAVSGTGSLNVNGTSVTDTGTLKLYGVNTYTGATVINAGLFQLGSGANGSDGSIATTTGVTDNASFEYNLFGAQTAAYVISGTGNLIKAGAGTLTLSAANNYAGITNVSAGVLSAGTNSAGTTGPLGYNSELLFANSATAALNLNTFNVSVGSLTGGGTTGGNINLGSGTLTVGGDNTTVGIYAGIINGSGGIVKVGTGTLTLSGINTYTGGTNISGGTLDISQVTPTALSTGNISIGTATLQYNDTNYSSLTGYTLTNNIALFNSSSTIEIGPASGSSTFSLVISGTISGSGTLNKTGIGTLLVSPVSGTTNSYSGGTVISSGTLDFTTIRGLPTNSSAGSISMANGTTFQYDGFGGVTSYLNTFNISGTSTINLTSSSTPTLTLDGVISGSGQLVKTGPGLLQVVAQNAGGTFQSNTYTGGTNISAGTLQLYGVAYELPSTGTVLIESGAALQFYNTSSTAQTLPNVPFMLTSNSSGGNSTIYTNSANNASGFVLTLPGVVSGAGTLLKTGTAGLTLTGSNTYTGGTNVAGGLLTITGTQTGGGFLVGTGAGSSANTIFANFSSGSTITSTGLVQIGLTAPSASTVPTLNDSGMVSNSGALLIGRYGLLNVNSGGVWNQSGAFNITAPSGSGVNAGPLTVNTGGVFNYTGAGTINLSPAAGQALGSANIAIAGGTFNTSQGFNDPINTVVAAGTTAGSNGSAGIALSLGGTLQLTNNITALTTTAGTPFNISLGTLSGGVSGVINTNGFSTATASTITGIGGILAKAGAGTLGLSGTSTYSGGTQILGGTLQANSNTNSLGTGYANVSAGVLAGSGNTGSGTVTVNGGTITAGTGATVNDSTGMLATAGNQNWSSGTYVAKVAGANSITSNDELVMSGLSIASGFNLVLTAMNGSSPAFTTNNPTQTTMPVAGSFIVLAWDQDTNASTNPFSSLASLYGLLNFSVNGTVGTAQTTDSIQLATEADASGTGYDLVAEDVAAPEPTSALLLGAAVSPFLLGRRRRRSASIAVA